MAPGRHRGQLRRVEQRCAGLSGGCVYGPGKSWTMGSLATARLDLWLRKPRRPRPLPRPLHRALLPLLLRPTRPLALRLCFPLIPSGRRWQRRLPPRLRMMRRPENSGLLTSPAIHKRTKQPKALTRQKLPPLKKRAKRPSRKCLLRIPMATLTRSRLIQNCPSLPKR